MKIRLEEVKPLRRGSEIEALVFSDTLSPAQCLAIGVSDLLELDAHAEIIIEDAPLGPVVMLGMVTVYGPMGELILNRDSIANADTIESRLEEEFIEAYEERLGCAQ